MRKRRHGWKGQRIIEKIKKRGEGRAKGMRKRRD